MNGRFAGLATVFGAMATRLAVAVAMAVVVTGTALPGAVRAADSAGIQLAAADDAAAKKHPGRKVFMRMTCIACHGKDGRGAIQDYPNLAGQDGAYMLRQMQDILSGKRSASPDATGHPRTEGMRGALVTPEGQIRITDQQITDVTAWLAGLEPAAPMAPETPVDAARVEEGEKLFKTRKCVTCHGKEGKKPLKSYPYVAGQKRAYIVNQTRDIRDKVRANSKSKLMFAQVRNLSDEDIGLIADYLSQVDRTQ